MNDLEFTLPYNDSSLDDPLRKRWRVAHGYLFVSIQSDKLNYEHYLELLLSQHDLGSVWNHMLLFMEFNGNQQVVSWRKSFLNILLSLENVIYLLQKVYQW